MVVVRIVKNIKGQIISFEAKGHAFQAEHGKDIVCAGVSSLTQTAVLGLQEYLKKEVTGVCKPGYLKAILIDEADNCTEAILQTMLIGLKEIKKLYADFFDLKVSISKERR